MRNIDKKLQALYICTLSLAACVAIYFEFINPDHFGCLFSEDSIFAQNVFEGIVILVCLAFTYGSVKLLVLKRLADAISTEKGYLRWAVVRWGMISISILLCVGAYYLLAIANVLPFLLITGIILFLIWPTKERREREMSVKTDEFRV